MEARANMEALIASGLEQLGLSPLPSGAAGRLAQYGQALIEKNQVMNLTAITEPFDVATLHMLDCAALLGCAPLAGGRLIDVGTGAGFPGMVLKLLVPSLDVTLLDGLQKRLDWLDEVGHGFALSGLRTLHGRAEEAGRDSALREQFDFATARAVADLGLLCELTLPFLRIGGRFLAMKSVDCGEELARAESAIRTLGGRFAGFYDYTIPHTQVIHRVVMVEKTAATPEKYPRRWAKMQKGSL